jgi:very-short-patch-repair endonuclease
VDKRGASRLRGKARTVDQAGRVESWHQWWSAVAATPIARRGLALTTAELAALGWTRQQARTRVRRGTWTSAGYGFVAPVDIRADHPQLTARRRHALACVAAARRRREHAVGDRSAAILHGLPTFTVPERPELTDPRAVAPGRHSAAHVRPAGLRPDEITHWHATPVLTPARTLVDLGRHDRRDAIMAADAALAADLVTPRHIAHALDAAYRWPGVRQAREVLALATRESDSPLESLTRLALHDDGFPAPQLQVLIPGTSYRVDMLWPQQRLILEIDGLEKYTEAELRREKRRELRLRALGYRVERVGWVEVVLLWPQTRVWLAAALQLPRRAG